MSHHLPRTGYARMVKRLNKFPQGATPSPLLESILALLCNEREAELLSRLPLLPFTARKAAGAWKTGEAEARKILDDLSSRALLIDLACEDDTVYFLPPPMAGFFEFSLMRVRTDIDQQALSELFHQYINVEEDFVRDLFAAGETRLGRIFVHEPALSPEISSRVLDYERASEVIRSARQIGLGLCYCRHKMSHLGKGCGASMEICMSLNAVADPLIRHGHARKIDAAEGLDLLQKAYDQNLVQFGDNVREGVNFICHCCGCCCEALLAMRRFATLHPVQTTNFVPVPEPGNCRGCGRCAAACPMDAIMLEPDSRERPEKGKIKQIDMDRCLGCGLCVRGCNFAALALQPRGERVLTPVDTAHRVVLMAIERGRLQNLIFDNQAHTSHRAMAAILGAILRLPPVKQLMAGKQMKSRYMERVLALVPLPKGIR